MEECNSNGISEDTLSSLLTVLVEGLFIVRKDENTGVHYFTDPIYRKAAMKLPIIVENKTAKR